MAVNIKAQIRGSVRKREREPFEAREASGQTRDKISALLHTSVTMLAHVVAKVAPGERNKSSH